MNKLDRYDPGKPGTFRFHRVMNLDQTQDQVGALCNPPLRQAQIFFLEAGRTAMHNKLAERLAQGFFAELFQQNRKLACDAVWSCWFATIAAYGSPKLRSRANALKETRGFLPGPLWKFAQGAGVVEQLPAAAGKAVNQ